MIKPTSLSEFEFAVGIHKHLSDVEMEGELWQLGGDVVVCFMFYWLFKYLHIRGSQLFVISALKARSWKSVARQSRLISQ